MQKRQSVSVSKQESGKLKGQVGQGGAAPQQVAASRIPTVFVIIDACGARAMLPIKIDQKMAVAQLKEQAKQNYATYCQDEGVAFNPPSPYSVDYDIFQCADERGSYDAEGEPWPDLCGVGSSYYPLGGVPPVGGPGSPHYSSTFASAGSGANVTYPFTGPTVRELLSMMIPPVFAYMTIGRRWLERDECLTLETKEREEIVERRRQFMQDLVLLADVSMEKQRSLHLFRERQASMAGKVEEAVLNAFTDYRKYEAKVRHQHQLLCKGYELWKQCLRTAEGWVDDANKQKRMTFSLAVSTLSLLKDDGTVASRKIL